ncbi:conserved hypothetical protein. Putative glycosyltransferase [Flavobacterium psychrophilum]|uniref:glycosyltransferase family 4 protein n=1 Tax=Flavobacterium psychrophilum TaxID=96345 RepID=UPI000B7C09B4|nr:glycosyltransferase family 4 protein [Flavobacterium psychrophilum]SNB28776.1 conserved hypothetical protein. Putative glycosyltransferase [Flavobacterium psychrophilum]
MRFKNTKILIISHNSFSKLFNNGKTLESIFGEFHKENLAQIFFSENEIPDLEYCNNYFKITDTNVLKSFFWGYSDCGSVVKSGESKNNGKVLIKRQSTLFDFFKSRVDYLTVFRDILWSFNSWKSKSLLNWVRNYNPDIVFYVGGNYGFSHKIARYVSKKFNLPLVTYFTDDYLIYPIDKNIFEYLQHQRIKLFYPKTIQQSSLCYAIGDLMANEYSNYFKKGFISIMNSVEKQDYVRYKPNVKIEMSYFGGLHLNRWQMLIKLANLVTDIKINVYCVEKPNEEILKLFLKSNINFRGAVEGENLKKAILSSDILLHVESNDLYYKSLTKLSISTKIPEYLMSGRFILGFGPPDVASMRILSDNHIGKVISSELTDGEIKTELDSIISNSDLRETIGKKGYNYAIEHYDKEKIAKDFKTQLEKIKT